MDEFVKFMQDNQLWSILIAILTTLLNLVLIQLKTRKSKAEKELIKAQKTINNNFTPQDYLAKVGDKYYQMSEVEFIKKDEVMLEDYLASKEV